MGISEDEFFSMTMRQFMARRHGYIQRDQNEWERARYTGYLSMLPHVDRKKRLKITDLGRFPWEQEEQRFAAQSPEEVARINERHKRALAQFKAKRDGIS